MSGLVTGSTPASSASSSGIAWRASVINGNPESPAEEKSHIESVSNVAVLVDGNGTPSSHVTRTSLRADINPCPAWKRATDMVGATVGLILLSPLLLAIAVLIKSVSEGPVFFRQRRFGARGRSFVLWKFRTLELSDANGQHRLHVSELMASNEPLKKRDCELTVIPFGHVLRRLGLDELPQLINVLKGEMSLVGPRPDVVPPRNYLSWQRRRFEVNPGMTGLWQVCGKNTTNFTTMMRLDAMYVRRRSLSLDLIILLRTLPAIARNST